MKLKIKEMLEGTLVAFLLFFAACSDIGERDNPLDPGASNYVAQVDTVYQVVEISKDEAVEQLYEDIKNGKVDSSDGLSQSLIDSVKSGSITADDLKNDSIFSKDDQKALENLTQKNIEESRDTIEVIVPISSSQANTSSSAKSSSSTASSSSVKSSSSSSVSTSSSSVKSSSSVFKIEDYLNPNVSYGEITDDRDGQVYKTIVVAEQTWMAQNLNFETEKSYCYDDKPENCVKYGRLYTWAAVMDSVGAFSENGKGCGYGAECSPRIYLGVRGVCPEGFHLPSQVEWNELLTTILSEDFGESNRNQANDLLKSTKGWKDNKNGSDDYGFFGLPAGARNRKGGYYNEKTMVNYWLPDFYNKYAATRFGLSDAWGSDFGQDQVDFANSVRCVKDRELVGVLKDERDGQEYKTVIIGKQKWMTQNLNYNVAESICAEDEDDNCTKYGRLYTWLSAIDTSSGSAKGCTVEKPCDDLSYPLQGVCPNGWHLPTVEEIEHLILHYTDSWSHEGDSEIWGYARKLQSTYGWSDIGGFNGTDDYGFNAYPSPDNYGGAGFSIWTSTEDSYNSANYMWFVACAECTENTDYVSYFSTGKGDYRYVRCVENDK